MRQEPDTEYRRELAKELIRRARRIMDSPGNVSTFHDISKELSESVGSDAIAAWLRLADDVADARMSGPETGPVDERFPSDVRRRYGIYFTPRPLARWMARQIRHDEGCVVDLAAGDGMLLAEAVRRRPGLSARGVERDPLLAVAAALRIREVRQATGTEGDDFVECGDGLKSRRDLRESRVVATLGNPPYVREKGNRRLFERIRTEHPDLGRHFRPRMDLHYLFVHRSLDYLSPGGDVIFLTSEYWLAAEGARALREDLSERTTPEVFVRLGGGRFAGAPGHHSLLMTARRRDGGGSASVVTVVDGRDADVDEEGHLKGANERDVDGACLRPERWSPFAPVDVPARVVPGETLPLEALCRDHQGFVSGVDRVTRRNIRYLDGVELDEPVFLYHRDELDESDQTGVGAMRPLIRGSDCVANRVWVEPPARDWVFYVDSEVDGESLEEVEERLAPFRELLERRREVERGTMPWYRLHWPRNRSDMLAPKLVVPRRAPEPRFCLDVSASLVSSDCTYIRPPEEAERPLRWLLMLMIVLNSDDSAARMRHYGKSKGDQIEFYSAPLQRLHVPLRRSQAGLESANGDVERRADAALRELERGTSPFTDV